MLLEPRPTIPRDHGEVSEWFKVPLSKSGVVTSHRGFESRPLRHPRRAPLPRVPFDQFPNAGYNFEQADRPGGLLRYGIPDYKLPKELIDRRVDQMAAEGVGFRCGVRVGRDISVRELQSTFHAIGLAVAARRPRELPIPGRELAGVHLAMEYLEQQNRRVTGLPQPDGLPVISAADAEW